MRYFERSSILMSVEFAMLTTPLPLISYKCSGCHFIVSAGTHCNYYILSLVR